MPTTGCSSPCDENPRLWEALRKKVEAEMIAAGWNPFAGKFNEVARRKQWKAWRRAAR